MSPEWRLRPFEPSDASSLFSPATEGGTMTSQTRGFTIGEQGLAGFVAWQARPFGFLPGES
jgi:hypothetical protein